MSLFKVCSWWNFQCSDIESNYDSFSLLTCRFLGNGSDCIIVVSHCGYLSILQPAIRDIDLNGNYNVQHSSILVETILSDPILGVLCGNFFGTQKTDNNVVAVLHPFKLVLYTVVTSGGPMIEIGNPLTALRYYIKQHLDT